MNKDEKSKIKYRMKRLARKFCRRNHVYESFDGSVGELIKKGYLSAYLLCLHENKNRATELEKENAELKEQNANLIAMLKAEREVRVNDEYLKGICERDAEIDKLKMGLKWDADNRDELLKENAKLKETVACLREDIDVKRKDIDWYKKRGAELDSMLTDKIREVKKAKEIIKELLDLRCSVSSAKDVENRFAVREKAKRFLEEEE